MFSECTYLPELIYPFIRTAGDNSPRLCFELLATLVLNHWQLWFEFAPELPINYLSMIENLMKYYEPNLLKFYTANQITTTTYAWQLLSSSFSDVLNSNEWCQLWDHILTRSSYFLMFCVIAFNSIHKLTIMQITKSTDIQRFFAEENVIDMKKFLQRAYDMMDICPNYLHPKFYMNEFQSLNGDVYQKFFKYPKKEMENRLECKRRHDVQRLFNDQLYQMERIQYGNEQQLCEKLRTSLEISEDHGKARLCNKSFTNSTAAQHNVSRKLLTNSCVEKLRKSLKEKTDELELLKYAARSVKV